MMKLTFAAKEIAEQLCEKSKALALEASKVSDSERLMELSLDILMLSQRLDSVVETLADQEKVKSEVATKKLTDQSPQELEVSEVIKLGRKLPRWARNKGQINTQILHCYIKIAEVYPKVSEEKLREEFVKSGGDEVTFSKNFPQMKIISAKNHGKVFDVVDGEVVIWTPAVDIVETFKEIYNSGE
jgi:hypothetical protein